MSIMKLIRYEHAPSQSIIGLAVRGTAAGVRCVYQRARKVPEIARRRSLVVAAFLLPVVVGYTAALLLVCLVGIELAALIVQLPR